MECNYPNYTPGIVYMYICAWQLILYIYIYIYIYISADMIEVSLQPRNCICPSKGYTCNVSNALEFNWKTNTTSAPDLLYTTNGRASKRRINGFLVNFTHMEGMNHLANFTSTLLVTDINLNATDITCEGLIGGMIANDTITLCIIGMLRY